MLPKGEVEKRVSECYRLRYEQSDSITQSKWVEYCHEVYGDKSEQQYCAYWAKAKQMYDNEWRDRLNELLGPATEKLREHLQGPDGRLSDAAIAKIFQYTGNNVEKVEAKVDAEIKVKFGSQE